MRSVGVGVGHILSTPTPTPAKTVNSVFSSDSTALPLIFIGYKCKQWNIQNRYFEERHLSLMDVILIFLKKYIFTEFQALALLGRKLQIVKSLSSL